MPWPLKRIKPTVDDAIRYALRGDDELSGRIRDLERQVDALRRQISNISHHVMPND